MNEVEYQKAKRRLWRMTGKGNHTADRMYSKLLAAEEEGKSTEEIVAMLRGDIRTFVRKVLPLWKGVREAVEGETGMTFEDFLWLRDYAPSEEE